MGLLRDAIGAVVTDPHSVGRQLDSLVAIVAPGYAHQRAAHRFALTKGYEAASPSHLRKFSYGNESGDELARAGAMPVREQARHLQRNYDLARGILRTMANFTVGANGIQVEPQPRRLNDPDKAIHDEFAEEISESWKDWCRKPEVTWTLSFAQVQRLAFMSMYRDGEVFSQTLEGFIPTLDHGTIVPFSVELLEADHVPLYLDDPARGIYQGVEINTWRRPRAYYVLKEHPGNTFAGRVNSNDYKRIPADRMLHPRLIDRIGQLRGVSEFASIINRLADAKEYEDSERIAAKVASSMAAAIKKGDPAAYGQVGTAGDEFTTPDNRQMRFQPGMIFDDLLPGESIEVIDSKRPNQGLDAFIQTLTRRLAAGAGASYSSISKNYNGTYSSQRQELVESWISYSVLAEHFAAQFVRPIFERWLNVGITSGRLRLPPDVDPLSLDDALYQAQAMPWIDPLKEANANQVLEEALHASGPEIIRRRGGNPLDVARQSRRWQGLTRDLRPGAQPAPEPETQDAEE